jgi:hypothetical protein
MEQIVPEEGGSFDENESDRGCCAASEPICLSCRHEFRDKIGSVDRSNAIIKITWRRRRVRGTAMASDSARFFGIPKIFRAGKGMGKVAEHKQVLRTVN